MEEGLRFSPGRAALLAELGGSGRFSSKGTSFPLGGDGQALTFPCQTAGQIAFGGGVGFVSPLCALASRKRFCNF